MFGLGKDLDRKMFVDDVGRSKNPGVPVYSGPPERMRTGPHHIFSILVYFSITKQN